MYDFLTYVVIKFLFTKRKKELNILIHSLDLFFIMASCTDLSKLSSTTEYRSIMKVYYLKKKPRYSIFNFYKSLYSISYYLSISIHYVFVKVECSRN
jgi:hypothetical protein